MISVHAAEDVICVLAFGIVDFSASLQALLINISLSLGQVFQHNSSSYVPFLDCLLVIMGSYSFSKLLDTVDTNVARLLAGPGSETMMDKSLWLPA